MAVQITSKTHHYNQSSMPFYVVSLLLALLLGNHVIAQQNQQEQQKQPSNNDPNDKDVCDVSSRENTDSPINDSSNNKEYKIGTLTPNDLSQPVIFSNYTTLDTIKLQKYPQLGEWKHKIGTVTQVNHLKSDTKIDASFHVVEGIVPRTSIAQMKHLLQQSETVYDVDPDTVDGMPTYELFVNNPGIASSNPNESGMKLDDHPQRIELRSKMQAILQPILDDYITPLVQQTYPNVCDTSSSPDRTCTPCYSLIRRYLHNERQSHAMHHDGHAIVTVVVSLSDYEYEYRGGLYVATGHGTRNFLNLNQGDLVIHQSTLLHGVQVYDIQSDDNNNNNNNDDDNNSNNVTLTNRWSWILWFRDSTECHDYSKEWFEECAMAGDAICQQLHATKVDGGIKQVIEWNVKAAEQGAGMAAIKMARAHLHQLQPSDAVPFNVSKAKEYFEIAVQSNNPDGHYGLAQLYLSRIHQDKDDYDKYMPKAIYHLEQAAMLHHAYSQFNLGMAHTYGYANFDDDELDLELARDWFVESGLPEGYFIAANYEAAVENTEMYDIYIDRAKTLGYFSNWRRQAREYTGSGGAGGVNLNCMWPPAPRDGRVPPQF